MASINRSANKYELIITKEDDYLDVRLNGEMTLEDNFQVWVDIVQACDHFGIYNILRVSNQKRFTTLHAYGHTNIFPETGVTLKHRVAWVELNEENVEMIAFIETALKNRGLVNGALYPTEDEALAWLKSGEDQ